MNPLANPDAERALLNAVSNLSAAKPEAALEMLDSLKLEAEDFSCPEHADVFRAAGDFLRRGVAMELFALEAALAPSAAVTKAGGRKWLAPLLMEPDRTGRGRFPAELARVVRDASLRRRAVATLRRVLGSIQDAATDPAEALAAGFEAWSNLTTRTATLGTSEGDALRLAEMLDAAQKGRRELCIPTGVRELDAVIGGLQPGHLTMVGALPGVGKSALLATIARNLALAGRRVGFFSLEDERIWVARRFLSAESGVPLFLLATKPLTETQGQRVEEAQPAVYNTLRNVVIDDRQGLTPAQVAQSARDMVLNLGCEAILVDHLGEMRFERTERYDLDVGDALSSLRDVAKRHQVPVLVASHVKRRPGLDLTDEPKLTDFANSSAPERMARVALGLSKPQDGCLRVTVLKQTNGRSGQVLDLALIDHAAMVDNERVALVQG